MLSLPRQGYGYWLIVRLNNYAYRLALVESVERNRKTHHHGAPDLLTRLQFVFRRKRRQRVLFQCGKGLLVTIEINGGDRVARRFAARRGQLSRDIMNPQ